MYTTPPVPPNCTIPATSDIYVPSGDASYNATRDALIAFKTALGNPMGNPAALSSWQAGTYPCSWPGWAGVSCNSDAVVSGLFLQDMGLTGSLPSAVTQLTGVESLVLKVRRCAGDGQLQGTRSVSSLILLCLKLVLRYAFGCGANGFKCFLATCAQGNQLTGALPAGISALSRLHDLDLRTNNFTGRKSTRSTWGHQHKLTYATSEERATFVPSLTTCCCRCAPPPFDLRHF